MSGPGEDARYIADVAVRLHELERKEAVRAATLAEISKVVTQLHNAGLPSKVDELTNSIAQLRRDLASIEVPPDLTNQVSGLERSLREIGHELIRIRTVNEHMGIVADRLDGARRADERFYQDRADDATDLARRFDVVEDAFRSMKNTWGQLSAWILWIALGSLLLVGFAMSGVKF